MFIIPVGNRVDWKRPPVVTLLLILINCFVFFFMQSGDDRHDELAAKYYFSSDLPKWELTRYTDYLEQRGAFARAQQVRAAAARGDEDALLAMEEDGKFMRALHAGRIITRDAPEFAGWQAERGKYESMRSFTARHIYYVGEPSAASAFTSAFMHGGFDHLFGNMVVLFLVGFLVESVIGKALFALGYFVSIFGSVFVFTLTAHDGALLGASGAIAGVMGMYTVIFGLRKIDFFYSLGFYFDYVRAPAIALLPLWLGNELYQFLSEKGAHVAYMAHFGGLLCGAALGALYRSRRPALIDGHHEAVDKQEFDQEAFQRGMAHLSAMNFSKALAVFKSLLDKHPDDLNLARLVYRAAKADPSSDDYHRAAQRMLALPGTDSATVEQTHTIFREYMGSAKPRPRLAPDLIASLARRFAVSGHCEDADKLVAFLRRAAPRHADLPAALLALARGYFRQQRRDKFEEILQALITQFPQSREAEAAKTMLRAS
jgi:membrane associated rhomboid family serine protease